jgi:hypothetical protein
MSLQPSHSATSCITLFWLARPSHPSFITSDESPKPIEVALLAPWHNDTRFGLALLPPRIIYDMDISYRSLRPVWTFLYRVSTNTGSLTRSNTTSHAPYQRSKAAGPHSADSCQECPYQNGSLRAIQQCRVVECFENVSISTICKLWFHLSFSCQPTSLPPRHVMVRQARCFYGRLCCRS